MPGISFQNFTVICRQRTERQAQTDEEQTTPRSGPGIVQIYQEASNVTQITAKKDTLASEHTESHSL